MKKIRIIAVCLALLTVLTVILTGCAGKQDAGQIYFSMEDLQGPDKTFSLWLGCGFEPYVEEAFPEADMVFGEYVPDLALNVKQGKADAMVLSEPYFKYFHDELSGMVMLPGDLDLIENALIFSSAPFGNTLRIKFDIWLASAMADGTIAEIEDKWFGGDESKYTLDYSMLDPSAEHIRVGLTADEPPFSYRTQSGFLGHDVEIIVRFCIDCGYYPDMSAAEYNAMVIAIQSDKYDVIAGGYELMDEREENVSFSDPIARSRVIVAVNGATEKVGFFESVAKSFRRTFIDDNRAKQFLGGIGITALITVCSVVLGTLLGFGIYLLERDSGKAVQGFFRMFSVLLHRVPTIVLLMVLYYIIFGKVNINPVLVSIILFTISFSVSTFESVSLAINSVGKAQSEAAFTLGLGKNETLFRILLPQGRAIFLSGFKDNIVYVLLESAVVGYIAIEDLTRVGDIIRNSTYEAFFPLIAVAVFYLIISSVIMRVIVRVERRSDPMNRSKEAILRSVLGKET